MARASKRPSLFPAQHLVETFKLFGFPAHYDSFARDSKTSQNIPTFFPTTASTYCSLTPKHPSAHSHHRIHTASQLHLTQQHRQHALLRHLRRRRARRERCWSDWYDQLTPQTQNNSSLTNSQSPSLSLRLTVVLVCVLLLLPVKNPAMGQGPPMPSPSYPLHMPALLPRTPLHKPPIPHSRHSLSSPSSSRAMA